MLMLLRTEWRWRPQNGARDSGRKPRHVRLVIEKLETRQCPSALDLTTLTDVSENPTAEAGAYFAGENQDLPPDISLTASNLGGNIWTFSGQVSDDQSVAGLVVNLGGIPSLQGVKVTTNSQGWFTYTCQLGANESGTATAQTKAVDGQSSNIAWTIVN